MRSFPRSYVWQWSVEQMSGLSPLGASGIAPRVAKGMPAKLCAGFRAPQIAMFRDFFEQHVCEQWTPECMANIHAEEFVGFTQECWQRLRPAALALLSADQISKLQPTTFYITRPEQIAALPGTACAGITPKQMSLLDYGSLASQCASISGPCAMNLTTAAVADIQPQCMSRLSLASVTDAFFHELTDDQVMAFTSTQCGELDAATVNYLLTPDFTATAACVAGLQATQCSQITAAGLNYINVEQRIPSVNCACVGAIPASIFASLDATAVNSFSSSAISGLTASQCADLSATVFNNIASPNSLSPACLASLPGSTCSGLTAQFFNSFSNATSRIEAMQAECVLAVDCGVFPSIDPQVVSSFNITSSSANSLCAGSPNSSESSGVKAGLIIASLSFGAAAFALCICGALRKRRAGKLLDDHSLPLQAAIYNENYA